LHEQCLATDPETRAEHLALIYLELGGSPRHELLNLFADGWHRSQISQLDRLRVSLTETPDAPPAWREYIQNAIRQTRSVQVENFHELQLSGTSCNLKGDDLLNFWKKTWLEFAHSIRAWPDIRSAAKELNEEQFKSPE
jgi:hypothetical protein